MREALRTLNKIFQLTCIMLLLTFGAVLVMTGARSGSLLEVLAYAALPAVFIAALLDNLLVSSGRY